MIASDANPIQLWDPDDETFNEKEVCGITPICFCQPMQTNDTFPIQINDEDVSPDDFVLAWVDRYNMLVDYENFTDGGGYQTANAAMSETGIFFIKVVAAGSLLFLIDADDWTEGDPFTSRSASEFVLNGSSADSAYATQSMAVAQGERIRVTTTTVVSGTWTGSVSVAMSFNGPNGTVISASGATSYSANGTYEVDWVLEATNGAVTDLKILVTITPLTGSVGVAVAIENGVAAHFSDNDTLLKSDCIDVRVSWPCTEKLSYSNADDFAGLSYAGIGSPTFNFRVPATFYHEEPVEEMEDHELSTNEIIQISAKLEQKRKFEVGYVPYYFHKKIRLALAHQYVAIGDEQFIKRTNDRYEIVPGRKTYPLKMASVLLTDQDYIKRNLK